MRPPYAPPAAQEIERVRSSINSEGGRALAITTDVTDDHAVEALIDGATEAFGKLDILINNAGGNAFEAPLVELPRVEFEKVMTLNATSLFICTAAAASRMNEGGRIINISSFAADTPVPGHGHYCAAKAAVSMLTRVYAAELSPHIRVNAIVPGMIPTETVANALGLEDKDLPNLIETWPISRATGYFPRISVLPRYILPLLRQHGSQEKSFAFREEYSNLSAQPSTHVMVTAQIH